MAPAGEPLLPPPLPFTGANLATLLSGGGTRRQHQCFFFLFFLFFFFLQDIRVRGTTKGSGAAPDGWRAGLAAAGSRAQENSLHVCAETLNLPFFQWRNSLAAGGEIFFPPQEEIVITTPKLTLTHLTGRCKVSQTYET